jgi:hypothetical protein
MNANMPADKPAPVNNQQVGGARKNSRKNNMMSRKNSRKNNMMSRKNSRKNNMMSRKNNMTRRNNNQDGGARIPSVGSKQQVFNGSAAHTAGGLKKGDLMKHKGRIVSRKAHKAGLKAIKRLRAAGYVAKKGQFKLFSRKH